MLFLKKEVSSVSDVGYLVRQKGVEDVIFSDFYSAYRYYELALKCDFIAGRSFTPKDDYYLEMVLISYPLKGGD